MKAEATSFNSSISFCTPSDILSNIDIQNCSAAPCGRVSTGTRPYTTSGVLQKIQDFQRKYISEQPTRIQPLLLPPPLVSEPFRCPSSMSSETWGILRTLQ
jgi:hypothetical protein